MNDRYNRRPDYDPIEKAQLEELGELLLARIDTERTFARLLNRPICGEIRMRLSDPELHSRNDGYIVLPELQAEPIEAEIDGIERYVAHSTSYSMESGWRADHWKFSLVDGVNLANVDHITYEAEVVRLLLPSGVIDTVVRPLGNASLPEWTQCDMDEADRLIVLLEDSYVLWQEPLLFNPVRIYPSE